MKKNKLLIKHWLEIHPYKTSKTDLYYFRICESVRRLMNNANYKITYNMLDDQDKNYFACYLTGYLEDIVSEVGIWTTFLRLHNKYYSKKLPFYNTEHDNYFEGEINPEDIYFLVWNFLCRIDESMILNPLADDVIRFSEDVYAIFEEAYEVAPENEILTNYFKFNDNDYYIVREKMNWLFMDSYLFMYNRFDFNEDLNNFLSSLEELDSQSEMFYRTELEDDYTINKVGGILALNAKNWLAELLGETHTLYNDLNNLSERKLGYYLYKGYDQNYLYIQHLASDTEIAITRKSLDPIEGDEPNNTVYFMSVVNWQNEWWFSGIITKHTLEKSMIENEKKNIKSISLFKNNIEEKKELVKQQQQLFLKINNNSTIAFLKNKKELEKFYLNFFTSWNNEISKQTGLTPITDIENFDHAVKFNELPIDESVILFFNENSGMEIIFGYNHFIPDPLNQYYDEELIEDNELIEIITSQACSKEFLRYILNNYQLPQLAFPGEQANSDLLSNNYDFVLRYYKQEAYYSVPNTTPI